MIIRETKNSIEMIVTSDDRPEELDLVRGMVGHIKDILMSPKYLKEKEIVICSAVRTNTGKIIRGHRHAECMSAIRARHFAVGNKPEDQGFITSRNRYVDRAEGYRLQVEAGIKSANPNGGYYQKGQLYSEDLY